MSDQSWRRRRRVDLLGQRFERLLVISPARTAFGEAGWLCRCDCGGTIIAEPYQLRRGTTKSCGCLKREIVRKNRDRTTHGCRHTKAYKAWSSMKERCLHSWHKSYRYYGGAGITICNRWVNSFEDFLADMGHPPAGCTIDRIDPHGNYEPGNCRWATPSEQQRNKRNNRLLTAFGETKPASTWLDDPRCVANRTALFKRIESGWDHERAITQPLRSDKRRKSL